jgi:hypothetical protein
LGDSTVQQSDSPGPENYSGRGWNFIHIRSAPEMVTAPVTVFGAIFLLALLCAGLFLISQLISRVWQGNADTVPAASAALTAIAAIFGAFFLTWRTVIASQQARASVEQAAVSRESHYTSLFTKAVEQLGSGLIDQSQKMTAAAMQMADIKV